MAFLLTGDGPHTLRAPVITIGTFDGVHLGHRLILEELKRHAAAIGGESVVITFEPHPRTILQPDSPVAMLTPLAGKLALMEALQIDHVAVAPFTREFAALSAGDYVQHFLAEHFHPAAIVIGYDHRFGHDRAGDISTLRAMGTALHFDVHELPPQLIRDAAVSSTRIRTALSGGDVTGAALMLGRPYSLRGTVVHGQQLGRTLGYPTANIDPLASDQLVPAGSVYAVEAEVSGSRYGGMLSIGTRPTVSDSGHRSIEVHLFDFAGDIYGEELTLHFIQHLRAEEKFASLEALTTAIQGDEIAARDILKHVGR